MTHLSLHQWTMRRGISAVALVSLLVSTTPAYAASSWNPGLLVNTESFQVIDEGDSTTDVELRFGGTLNEKIFWDYETSRFEFTDDVHVTGNLTATGTIIADGVIKTKSDITINSDQTTDTNAVLTFGSDDVNETLTFADSADRFEFSDDVYTTGTLEVDGSAQFDGGVTIGDAIGDTVTVNGGAWTFANDTTMALTGGENGLNIDSNTLSIDGATNRVGVGTATPKYEVDAVGSIHASVGLSSSGSLVWEGSASGASLWVSKFKGAGLSTTCDPTTGKITWDSTLQQFVCGTDLNTGSTYTAGQGLTVSSNVFSLTPTFSGTSLEIMGTASGRQVHAQDVLRSSGSLIVDGSASIKTNLTVNADNGNAAAAITFGNDADTASLTFSNDADPTFTIDDTLNVTGNVDSTGTVTGDGNFTINEDNTGADAILTFGNDAAAETLRFNDTTNNFAISDDIDVTGNVDATGTVTGDGNFTINEDNTGADAILTFGNDAAAETLRFNDTTNNFAISDDIDVTGNVDATGTVSGDGNFTINEDQTAADTVLTFGSDGTNENITFQNSRDRFEFSDDIKTTGYLSGATLTVDGTVTFRGKDYNFPLNGGTSGSVLRTDGAGNLGWYTSMGDGSGDIIDLQPSYPNAIYYQSGSSYIGQLAGSGGLNSGFENTYQWASSKSTIQDYWVSTRIRVPDDFLRWDPVKSLQLRYRTKTSTTSQNHITVKLLDTAGTAVALTGGATLANTSFTTANITGPSSAGTYTPGGFITVLVKLAANSSGQANAGFLTVNWESRK